MRRWVLLMVIGSFLAAGCAGLSGAGGVVEVISVADLRQAMSAPGLTLIDVRDSRSWESSRKKIPGAIREDPAAVSTWQAKYGPSSTVVVYCA